MRPILHLYLIDPARNCYRYYILSVQPGLFKEWSLRRAWGRMGARGCDKTIWFASQAQAERFYERKRREKLRRGYQPSLFLMTFYGQQQTPASNRSQPVRRHLSTPASTTHQASPYQQELFGS